jgi:hypothetical protein
MKRYMQTVGVLGLLGLFLSGCASGGGADTGYGAQPREVRLETVPTGVQVYVIPNTVWVKRGDELVKPENRTKLTPYAVGMTPVTTSLPPYKHVLLAFNSKGEPATVVFVPQRNMTQSLTIHATSSAGSALDAHGTAGGQ